ncbi:hypothetical protein D9M68_304480 [compost metagenome]
MNSLVRTSFFRIGWMALSSATLPVASATIAVSVTRPFSHLATLWAACVPDEAMFSSTALVVVPRCSVSM